MKNILDQIVEQKRIEVQQKQQIQSIEDLKQVFTF
jgi:hypothetical protein